MEKIALLTKNYAWPSVDSRKDYKYIKKFIRNLVLRWLCTVVNYSAVTVTTNMPVVSRTFSWLVS